MVTLCLVMAVIILAGLLIAACMKIERTQQEVRDMEYNVVEAVADHLECHAKIEAMLIATTKGKDDAALLREMADLWESPEEIPYLNQLGREKYRVGGPSMPAIWLREQAKKREVVDIKIEHPQYEDLKVIPND